MEEVKEEELGLLQHSVCNGIDENKHHEDLPQPVHELDEVVPGFNRQVSIFGKNAAGHSINHTSTKPQSIAEEHEIGCQRTKSMYSPKIGYRPSQRFHSSPVTVPSSPPKSEELSTSPHVQALQHLFDQGAADSHYHENGVLPQKLTPINGILSSSPTSSQGGKKNVHDSSPLETPIQHSSTQESMEEIEEEESNDAHSVLPKVTFSNVVKREISNDSTADSDVSFFLNKEVDEVQRTVMSLGDLSIDTQDSETNYWNSPFVTGNLKFTRKSLDEVQDLKRHYVVVPYDITPYELTYFMERYWNMRSPKIVLSIISGMRHEKIWKHSRLRTQFKKGLIRAANATEMWITTNGVDDGVASLVGEAIHEEKIVRTNSKINLNQLRSDTFKRLHKLTVIGILPKSKIVYQHLLDGSEGVKVTNEGVKPGKDRYELNADHTHFVLVDTNEEESYVEFRSNFEKQLEVQLGKPRRYRRFMTSDDDDGGEIIEPKNQTIPVVGLLIHGIPAKIDLILFYLRKKMPVVVVKGSGGCADLLAFAFEEIQDRSEDTHLRSELLKMIMQYFPEDFKDNDFHRNAFRDKVIECASLAKEDDRTFMTIINPQGTDGNLADLDKYLLKALLKSEIKSNSRWRERAYKDLLLLLDWNKPDLANTEIFASRDISKMRIDKTLFEKSLLRKDREDFVSLFLDQGFQIHKYLNHKNLKYLFEKAEDSEFFQTVCLQGILGKTHMNPDQPLPQDFLMNDLNKLVAKLSGIKNFVQPYELSMNSAELYILDPAVAERKAINCLIIWAVLLSRPKLAKVLWNRCDEPIPVALIISNMYRELSKCPMERYQRTEMEECAQMFGNMALGVLDISYRDTSAQAYTMLSRPLPDFNNKSTIEIAHASYYLKFIAHPCCQKWLTKRLFGSIQVKEVNWGIWRMPYWFKILSSVWLIFPMFLWITFGRNKALPKQEQESSDEDSGGSDASSSDEETQMLPRTKSAVEDELRNLQQKNSKKKRFSNFFRAKKHKKIPLSTKFEMMWTAPITKFWTTQMFYFIYLGLFCLATLWPTCGNVYLDLVVWSWTLIILIEVIRHTYIQFKIHKGISLAWNYFEIIFISVFLVLYLGLRVVPYAISYKNVFVSKTVLSIGLIFFFYRLPITYLPISPTLGPMLVRISRMVRIDFVSFIRMFLIYMISGGVAIQAILYPNFPLSVDLIRRVLTRPLFAMFLTQIDDLTGHDYCSPYYDNLTSSYCVSDPFQSVGSHMYKAEPGVEPVHKCPQSSLGGYLITIQYLLICKLVLVTLLFVMFSMTNNKIDKEADEIWKFQRYMLILDFEERLCFPPPLTVINYMYLLACYLHSRLGGCREDCIAACTSGRNKKELKHKVQKIKRSEDFNYWKKCSYEYVNAQENQNSQEIINLLQAQILQNLQDDMRNQRKIMKRVSDRVIELERMLHSNKISLESISHKLDKSDVLGVSSVKGLLVHVAARLSPYPGTNVARFPVLDGYVPWEKSYDIYDPKVYSKPSESYTEVEKGLLDEDIIDVRTKQLEREALSEEEGSELPPLPNVNYSWNKLITIKRGRSKKIKQLYDRRSWITLDNEMVRYHIDPLGLPINPMGRTGLKGRGALWRWGPNHEILAVCTRWRRTPSSDGQPSGYLYVEGKRVLEFIAIRKVEGTDDTCFGLPGDYLHGLVSRYNKLVNSFKRQVLDLAEQQNEGNFDQADLIQYFSHFAESITAPSVISLGSRTGPPGILTRSMSHPTILSSINAPANMQSLTTSRSSLKTENDSSGFSASQIYKGYIDDPRNTDNAWLEAEVWNFHYDSGEIFDGSLPEDQNRVMWKEVSPNVKIFGNEGVIVKEAAKVLDAYN